jgi:hypothetical protein
LRKSGCRQTMRSPRSHEGTVSCCTLECYCRGNRSPAKSAIFDAAGGSRLARTAIT